MLSALKENKKLQAFASWLGLFTSFGTLICCAIPSLLVVLGMGATLANFLTHVPQLIWLSEHKELVFGTSFAMLALSYAAQRYSASLACPIDQREACENAKGWGKPIFWASVVINIVGAFWAFVMPWILA